MLRFGWLAGAAAMVIGLVGCDSGSSPSSQISMTLKTYLSALANGQATRACDQITGNEIQALEQTAESVGASTCVQAINYVSQSLGGDNKQALLSAKVIDVHANGNTGTARIQGGTTTADFSKTSGHWYISGGLGGTGSSTTAATTTSSTSTTSAATTPTATTSRASHPTVGVAESTATAIRDALKLRGYTVTGVRAAGESKAFEAKMGGVTVYVEAFADASAARAVAGPLRKGASAGRGAITTEGSVIFFALGSGNALQAAVDAAANAVKGIS